MLTESDNERLDSIMDAVLQLREERGYPPPRDEDRIAEILQRCEKSAAEERQQLVESEQQFARPVRPQTSAVDSEGLKSFPQMDRWRGQKD